MEVVVNCYGTVALKQQKVLKLAVGESVEFDYLDEKIVVKVSELDNIFYTISLNRNFCFETFDGYNLLDTRDSFKFPMSDSVTIVLPLYDATYKLNFSEAKEEN